LLDAALLLPLAIATGCGGDGLPNHVGSITLNTIPDSNLTWPWRTIDCMSPTLTAWIY